MYRYDDKQNCPFWRSKLLVEKNSTQKILYNPNVFIKLWETGGIIYSPIDYSLIAKHSHKVLIL